MRDVGKALRKAKRVEKTPVAEVVKPVRMSYETYAYLKDLVQDQRKKLDYARDLAIDQGIMKSGGGLVAA